MELAYIWVEKFRNIENQGFNISSKYIFNYDKERTFLEILPNEKWIDNFFENPAILNVTAIIGQNASGKTNLLELINYALCEGNTKIAEPFFMVFCENDRFRIVNYRVSRIACNLSEKTRIEAYSKSRYFDAFYFTNVFDGRRHNFGKEIFDLSTNRLLQNQFGETTLSNFKKDIQNQILFLRSDEFNYLQHIEEQINADNHFNLRPSHVALISPTWSYIYSRAKAFDKKVSGILSEDYTDLKKFCSSFREKLTDIQSEKALYYHTAFLLFLDFIFNDFAPQVGGEEVMSKEKEDRILMFEEFSKDKDKGKVTLKEELLKLNLLYLIENRISENHSLITQNISDYIHKEYPNLKAKSGFMFELKDFDIYEIKKQHEGTYTNRKEQFLADFNPQIETFITRYLEVVSNSGLTFTIEWHGISSGHKAFLNLFTRFFNFRDKVKTENIVMTLDEGDLYFHPKWQIEYLSKLLKVLPIIFHGKNIQLILTTHSPFLVSDLPKNNLIFLFKDEIGNCRTKVNKDIEGETFAGNIGELYLDAFFLNGNMISHFAVSKIKKLFEKANEGNLSQNDRLLIGQIGEVIIKSQLLKLSDGTNSRQGNG